jgi:hypothetical protein
VTWNTWPKTAVTGSCGWSARAAAATRLSSPHLCHAQSMITWAGRPAGPLFTTATGKRMGQPEAWKMIHRLASRAALDGVAEISPYSLRVAVITGAREVGVPLEEVQPPQGTPTPAPPAATTAAAIPWTATHPTPSPPG